jgi:hypothetical protein
LSATRKRDHFIHINSTTVRKVPSCAKVTRTHANFTPLVSALGIDMYFEPVTTTD